MKLSFLLLPTLLALSSASLQDIVKQSSQHRNVSLLKPDLKHRVPETAVNMLVPTRQSPPSPAKLRQKRQTESFSSRFGNNGKLKWQTWRGSPPYGAVSIYNSYTERTDYVCRYNCLAGFYSSGKGSYCHYPNAGEAHRASSFEILVNDGNFEILEWKEDSDGSVPQNSVRTCTYSTVYVGQNKYGLGKVHPRNNAFYLPWEGSEYRYTEYKVLTINKDIVSEKISNVEYDINGAKLLKYAPETMGVSIITNHECNSLSQTTNLSITNQVEKRWDISSSFKLDIERTITAGIPLIASGNISISTQVTFLLSRGRTYTEETSSYVSVELSVPPNHDCRILMVGQKYKTNIPFTGYLSRTYRNGENKRTRITGTYDGTDMEDVGVVIERCIPVTKPKPCD